jgi:SAM-dependent methyltransferase
MPRDLDGLTAATLKHLRDRWWDEAFTDFLRETLQPRAGNRILDVGCGSGTAEVALGPTLTQVRLAGIDLVPGRVKEALQATRARNVRVAFAAADAMALPFADGAFDSTYCVAVLQYVRDVRRAEDASWPSSRTTARGTGTALSRAAPAPSSSARVSMRC